jgi:hypothetical protein
LGLRGAAGALKHGGNFGVIEALNVVENKYDPITWRQSGNGAINGQTVDGPGLYQITSAKAASYVLFRYIRRQLIE